jgi:hypothetical protein
MTKSTLFVAALLVASGAGVLAWQSSLPKVGVTQKDVETWATEGVNGRTDGDAWDPPGVSAAAGAAIQAMTPDQKAALAREVLTMVKAAVMAPAFRAAHVARINKDHHAINHGVEVDSFGPGVDPQKAMLMQTAIGIVQMYRMQPTESLKAIFENQRTELAETIKTETGDEKAKAQKLLTTLNGLAPLMKSNPEEFKKAFTLAMSANIGGPATEEAYQAASATGAQAQKLRDEQRNWNARNLNTVLKATLTNFADQLSRVDFKLATRINGADIEFVDRLQVMGGALVQLAYRFGPGPTTSTIAFLRAWAKEL